MQTKSGRGDPPTNGQLRQLVQAAGGGDQIAKLLILDFFEQEIDNLSRFMRMPRDEAKQALKLELLELIRLKAEELASAGLCAEPQAAYAVATNE
ncbi:helix-turn-helix domain-containing protein [Cohnella hashimotonis]|uniref:Helix-turn-helix domain-containing protein n=1 Tax=Cohnella hashimotonis TaxID=2826895 RepID=A0ABT6TCP8_9BACL|nr:helix-turn-helix domain-containing protein [Cohnella hashimotonis]MDI4644356.1 helix-turn-helix domain-containing protein [Cohnella hashimotonis]